MRIYVGNLSFTTSEESLREAFEEYGALDDITIVTERDTGRSRGFGFVEMSTEDALKAIDALHGSELDGRTLTVNEARERERRSGGGGGRGGGRRGGRGGRDRDRGRDW